MYILGINAYHGGASACLIRDGQLIAPAEEERFTRLKYWAGFSVQAICYALNEAGIAPQDLDHVGIPRDPSAHLMQKALFTLSKRPSPDLIRDRLNNTMKMCDVKTAFCEQMGLDANALKAEFCSVEHHRIYTVSAFFVPPFKEVVIFSNRAATQHAHEVAIRSDGC